jgi:uncharacterized membrane protein YedE/YeeE
MNQILGGVIIGLAATIMLLFSGRVTGISGILGGILNRKTQDKDWRIFFVIGLILGGVTLKLLRPDFFTVISSASTIDYMIAGLLVGFGTLLGNGCTSGHGVCGISRFSPRSLIATVTFITAGVISVILFKFLRGEL